MLATLTDAPFDDPAWVFESKWDGFRMVASIEGGKVTLPGGAIRARLLPPASLSSVPQHSGCSEFTSKPTEVIWARNRAAVSSHFAPRSTERNVAPVTFPPGRFRLEQ
jgi:hypothetical protein